MGLTPVGRRKVVKNPVEVQGMRQCHVRILNTPIASTQTEREK